LAVTKTSYCTIPANLFLVKHIYVGFFHLLSFIRLLLDYQDSPAEVLQFFSYSFLHHLSVTRRLSLVHTCPYFCKHTLIHSTLSTAKLYGLILKHA